jgi:hypothetical protein
VQLSIELDKPGNVYLGGEAITGKVILEAYMAGNAPIYLDLWWQTSGKCAPESSLPERLAVAQGWHRGRNELPFILTTPNGPFSYHGELFEVNWLLQITVNHSFGATYKKTLEILPDSAYNNPQIENYSDSRISNTTSTVANDIAAKKSILPSNTRYLALLNLAFIATLALLIYLAQIVGLNANPGNSPTPTYPVSFIILLLSPVIFMLTDLNYKFFVSVATSIATKIIPKGIIFYLDSPVIKRGWQNFATISLPKNLIDKNQSISLIGLNASLVCYELSGIKSIDRNKKYKNKISEHHLLMVKQHENMDHFHFEISIDVPNNAPHSFMTEDTAIEWYLVIKCPTIKHSMWKREQVIQVIP